jgi:hypothetical protein
MSACVLSKLDIDVLVQVAVYGPAGATSWTPPTDHTPDVLGTELWQQNYAAAAYPDEEPPLPEYRFEPLPFGITTIEALKACSCYGYQTADDSDAWRDGPARWIMESLRSKLIQTLAGWDEAPWGWEPSDVTERSGRGGAPEIPDTPVQATPPEDPIIAQVEAAFAAVGIALAEPYANPGPLSADIDPRLRVGRRELRLPGTQPWPILNVEMYRDEATASSVLRSLRAKTEREGALHDNRLTRTGRVVVSYFGLHGYQLPAHLTRAVTALGPPDEMWTSADPPVAVVRAEVAARRVPVTVTNKTQRVLIGHDEASLRTLAAVVDDDAVRQRILALDPANHAALILLGIASVDTVPEVALHDRVEGNELFITTIGATPMIATMLITDRLPEIPAMARLLDPGLGWRVTCTRGDHD